MDDHQEFELSSMNPALRSATERMKRRSEPGKCGYNLDRFPQTPRGDFICRVCAGVVRQPLECTDCGLLLCQKCWGVTGRLPRRASGYYFLYRGREFVCPACNVACSPREPSRLLRRLIINLEVRCKYWRSGCGVQCPLSDVKAHQKICAFKLIQCSNSLCCAAKGKREDFLKVMISLHEGIREAEMFVCSKTCEKTIRMETMLRRNEHEKAAEEFHRSMLELQAKIL